MNADETASDRVASSAVAAAADDIVGNLAPIIPPELLPQVDLIVHETVGQISTRRSGPLPDARELDAYKTIDPSFAERIMRMAEREQEQRHRLPGLIIERDYSLKSRGQHYALLATAIVLMFAGYLAYSGDTRMAGFVAIGTLASIVSIFVSGRAIDARADKRAHDEDEGQQED